MGEAYFQMLAFSPEEARDYFDVEEDPSLTQQDFEDFTDDLFWDAVTSDRMYLKQRVVDPEKYGIDSQLLHACRIEFPEDMPEPLAHLGGLVIRAEEPPKFRDLTDHLQDTPGIETPNRRWTLDTLLESDLL